MAFLFSIFPKFPSKIELNQFLPAVSSLFGNISLMMITMPLSIEGVQLGGFGAVQLERLEPESGGLIK